MADDERTHHNKLQIEYFDQRAELFQQKIPEDIQQRTAHIVKTAFVHKNAMILDVGTGAGVLIGHFLAAGAAQENIVGCDLSKQMLALAQAHYNRVFFFNGDVMEFSLQSPPSDFPSHIRAFTQYLFNACFGNMMDQLAVLRHVVPMLACDGKIVISHPLPQFVSSLHKSDPEIVPHLLPSITEINRFAKELGISVTHFESRENLYLAILWS